MATTGDKLTRVSTEAAEEFVQSFYPALNSNRARIASFYSPAISTILFNGNPVADGNAVQDIFVNKMPPTRYEVQTFDCQIINKAYPTPTATGLKTPNQLTIRDMSILVVVSGYVQFGAEIDQPQRGFSETFVLVPSPGGKNKNRSGWLIQSQNFRLVV